MRERRDKAEAELEVICKNIPIPNDYKPHASYGPDAHVYCLGKQSVMNLIDRA